MTASPGGEEDARRCGRDRYLEGKPVLHCRDRRPVRRVAAGLDALRNAPRDVLDGERASLDDAVARKHRVSKCEAKKRLRHDTSIHIRRTLRGPITMCTSITGMQALRITHAFL